MNENFALPCITVTDDTQSATLFFNQKPFQCQKLLVPYLFNCRFSSRIETSYLSLPPTSTFSNIPSKLPHPTQFTKLFFPRFRYHNYYTTRALPNSKFTLKMTSHASFMSRFTNASQTPFRYATKPVVDKGHLICIFSRQRVDRNWFTFSHERGACNYRVLVLEN